MKSPNFLKLPTLPTMLIFASLVTTSLLLAGRAAPESSRMLKPRVVPAQRRELAEHRRLGTTAMSAAEGEWNFSEIVSPLEETVRKLTGDDGYQFGDLSKRAASDMSKSVSKFTGKERYEFGDITKKALADADRALQETERILSSWRDDGEPLHA